MTIDDLIIRDYGEQCRKHLKEIESRLTQAIAALLYAGELGDNPLSQLNRAFTNFKRNYPNPE